MLYIEQLNYHEWKLLTPKVLQNFVIFPWPSDDHIKFLLFTASGQYSIIAIAQAYFIVAKWCHMVT